MTEKVDETTAKHKSNHERKPKNKKPYGRFFHPHKTWIDKLLSFLMEYLLPLGNLQTYKASSESKETKTILGSFRNKIHSVTHYNVKRKIQSWSDSLGEDGLFECTVAVPSRGDILYEWGILSASGKEGRAVGDSCSAYTVPIHLKIPGHLLKDQVRKEGEEYKLDWKSIDSSIPIVIWFHGGGMILAAPDGSELDFIRSMSDISSPVILATLDYRLAPEHPFPASVIDCLTAAAYMLDHSACSLNIGGISAGGNLATVVALECFRRYPGRVRSACIVHPMLDPNADSTSYFMNSTSSGACPVAFLRWCWRAYLQLDKDGHDTSSKISSKGSKWSQHYSSWRLICPTQSDLPKGLDNHSQSPKFVIVTALADPLHDEGVHLFQKLHDAGANAVHIESRGSHAVSLLFDAKARIHAVDAWRSGICTDGTST